MRRDPIKSAARTLEVLELFHERRAPLRLTEIFESLNYPQSSTTMLLKSMVLLGYINYDRPTRTYFPTPRVAALGDWINQHLYAAGDLVELMRSVQEQTDETVGVSSQNDIFVQHIRVLQPTHTQKMPPAEGSMRVLTKSAPGLVLLSRMTPKAIDRILRHIAIFERERIDHDQLLEQLRWVRQEGYCLLTGYPLAEAAGLAVPLPRAPHGIPLALAIGGLNRRITRKKTELLDILRRAVGAYEEKLLEQRAADTEAAALRPHDPAEASRDEEAEPT